MQRPIVTNRPDADVHIMVYNEDRSTHLIVRLGHVPEFQQGEYKYFAYAEMSDDGLLVGPRAPSQAW